MGYEYDPDNPLHLVERQKLRDAIGSAVEAVMDRHGVDLSRDPDAAWKVAEGVIDTLTADPIDDPRLREIARRLLDDAGEIADVLRD